MFEAVPAGQLKQEVDKLLESQSTLTASLAKKEKEYELLSVSYTKASVLLTEQATAVEELTGQAAHTAVALRASEDETAHLSEIVAELRERQAEMERRNVSKHSAITSLEVELDAARGELQRRLGSLYLSL